MEVLYKSTRSDEKMLTASQAIIQGLAYDGGLFMPDHMPKFNGNLAELKDCSYKEVAYMIMKEFFTDFTEEELKGCIERAYDKKFDDDLIAPLKKVGDDYYLELFHGATIAFKDMALSILPHLLTTSMKKNNINEKVVILTATSGDTGKAALSGFADVENTRIIVFYPKGGVSKIQELQMITQKGANTKVVGVNGNFDDCQSKVKEIFNNKQIRDELKQKGYVFSSANSINIGRLIPQVAYYFYAYARLLNMGDINAGEKINFVVPTGNFGNILAGYFAKQMGLPVNKLICASNDNKVLFDFFNSGTYDKNRKFILTSSPSMDILISSNLERLIYLSCGSDADKNSELMKQLAECGKYSIDDEMKEFLDDFVPGYASQADVSNTIAENYNNFGYVIDTHTAVASSVMKNYKDSSKDNAKCVVVSTASPYKFVRNVVSSVKDIDDSKDDFELIKELESISKVSIPHAVKSLEDAPILHNTVVDIENMIDEVVNFLV